MDKNATVAGKNGTAGLLLLLAMALSISGAQAQQASALDWHRVGNSAMERGLAGLASGPVDRVWYAGEGNRLFLRTSAGKIFETSDLDQWQVAPQDTLVPAAASGRGLLGVPEREASARKAAGQTPRGYAFGRFVYRSDDGGANWENLTAYRMNSIVGDGIRDLAIHPSNEDEVVIAGAAGVFRSVDGGRSWSGLNQGLPNLPALRIRSLPSGVRGVRLEMADGGLAEWQPGERTAWRSENNAEVVTELSLRQALSEQRGVRVTAVELAGDFVYAGLADGRIEVSPDGGRSAWLNSAVNQGGAVTRFWVDAQDPRVALAVLDSGVRTPGSPATHVLRTVNGGAFWDDITADLPDVGVYGVTADRASNAIYVATERGVFLSRTSLASLTPGAGWSRLAGLPEARAMDVRLDPGANRIWVALDGYGVYATLAPHRKGDPKLVSAADLVARAAAPGSLMSVTGARIESARAGNLTVPVLAATDTESQIQIPFDARGETLAISIEAGGSRRLLSPVMLGATAPAIFVDRDGAPLLLDGDSGVMLDAMHAAHSRSRVQILTTGLGRVTPEWPAGLPAPLENSPQVTASVKAWLDRVPVEVTRAVLAPGYIGFYLVEVELPSIVNYGPAELYIEAAGQASNRVRVYLEP